MLSQFFGNPLYVRVRKNQFHVRCLGSRKETNLVAQPPFTTTRLLIGQFQVAENMLKQAVKETSKNKLFAIPPQVLIHPLEMVEGGLSEVEERILKEVAIGAGASKSVVWVGHELSDDEVREKLNGK